MKYEVEVRVIEKHYLEVEADSENEAKEAAYNLVIEDGQAYHHDSDVDIDAFEV